MPNVSASWNASLPISLVETWPVIATTGIESIMASTRAGDQVGGAGSGGRQAHADFAGGARVAFGRETGVLLMPHQDVAEGVIVQGVVQRQRDAARDTRKCTSTFSRDQAFQHDSCSADQWRRRHKSPPNRELKR